MSESEMRDDLEQARKVSGEFTSEDLTEEEDPSADRAEVADTDDAVLPEEILPKEISPEEVLIEDADVSEVEGYEATSVPVSAGSDDESDEDSDEESETHAKAEEDEKEDEDPTSRLMRLKGKIEAALFITRRPLSIQELAETLGSHLEDTEVALMELINDYAFREDSALEIDDSEGYILQVREDYDSVVHKMMPAEISQGALRTLSAIAIKSPILQSDLVELRGASAYEHIPELLAKNLISKRRKGRSYLLNTTPTFHEYFRLTGEKKNLQGLVNQLARDSKRGTGATPSEGHEDLDGTEDFLTEDALPEAVGE